jgi:hypothetical protein
MTRAEFFASLAAAALPTGKAATAPTVTIIEGADLFSDAEWDAIVSDYIDSGLSPEGFLALDAEAA